MIQMIEFEFARRCDSVDPRIICDRRDAERRSASTFASNAFIEIGQRLLIEFAPGGSQIALRVSLPEQILEAI